MELIGEKFLVDSFEADRIVREMIFHVSLNGLRIRRLYHLQNMLSHALF